MFQSRRCEKFGGAHIVPPERHRLALESRADLVQRDMRGKRAGAWREVEREHDTILAAPARPLLVIARDKREAFGQGSARDEAIHCIVAP